MLSVHSLLELTSFSFVLIDYLSFPTLTLNGTRFRSLRMLSHSVIHLTSSLCSRGHYSIVKVQILPLRAANFVNAILKCYLYFLSLLRTTELLNLPSAAILITSSSGNLTRIFYRISSMPNVNSCYFNYLHFVTLR